ncbi:MAG: hypothetical protein DWQ05_09465 [Calditrichaeota bacterium]|nr:MAG: hypothetical protein DWQ05_09465 [Calditrichota bacterium]
MKKYVLSLTLFFTLCQVSQAQSLDGVLAKYYNALGGLAKLKSVQSIIQEGVFSTPMADVELQVTIKKKRPNKWISIMEIQGQKIIQAYDGEVAWMQNPMSGMVKPTALEGEQAEQIIRQANFDGDLVGYKENGVKLAFEGVADFEQMKCYKLRATRLDSQEVVFYIDQSSSFLIGTEVPVKTPEQNTTAIIKLGDYEEVDGLYYPHSLEVLGAQKMDFVFDDILINVDIPDAVFAMPVEKK